MRTPLTYTALAALFASLVALLNSGCSTMQWNPNATPGVMQASQLPVWRSPQPMQLITPAAAPARNCSTRTVVNAFGAYQNVEVCQ